MKVIFLDIDGVLNCEQTLERHDGFLGIEHGKVILLNNIVNETGAKIVLSSTWRLDPDWNDTMKSYGINCIDRTICLPSRIRGLEINEWIERHPDVKTFAIIDDDSDMLPGQKLFQTSFKEGLTEDISCQIIKYLNNQYEESNQ